MEEIDNLYANHVLNNSLNAKQIKGEQRVLSAFRSEGMYQNEGMQDSSVQRIRSNFIPGNKTDAKKRSAISVLEIGAP
jgi:hypothetical protein